MPNADSSTARTGTNGKAVVDGTLIYRLTQWTFNPSCNESAWGDSDSQGYTVRAAARKDGTGNIAGKYDTGRKIFSLFMPGDIVKLVLFETESDYWVLERALIRSFNLTFDMDSKEVVGWTADFGADGKYYYPGESGAPTETLPTS